MSEPDPPPGQPPLAPAQDMSAPQAYCANCGAPLHGRFCHDCGQPIQGLVRHFSSVLSDVVDSVFNIDERLFRTLLPLYLRPGRLTLEYFAGRRARYVTPFRLVFFLAVIAFFSIQVTVRADFGHDIIQVGLPHTTGTSSGSRTQAKASDKQDTALDRLIQTHSTASVHIAWLPAFVNTSINHSINKARLHLHQLHSGTPAQRKNAARQLLIGMFAVAPTVLFVLLPIFALMLKVFYIFKRRLYMEHLIVAMHSHAFLMLSMIVLLILGIARGWLEPHATWLATPLVLLNTAAWIWIFLYLLVMQKRVYAQGWPMTLVKFALTGMCYGIALCFALAVVALISLTR